MLGPMGRRQKDVTARGKTRAPRTYAKLELEIKSHDVNPSRREAYWFSFSVCVESLKYGLSDYLYTYLAFPTCL